MPSRPPTFKPAHQLTKRQANAEYDARRGGARARGYDARWDEVVARERARRPHCLGCQAIGRTVSTELVDHIVPHKGNKALFWDPGNRQPSCRPHHDIVKQKLERMYAEGKLTPDDLRLDSKIAIEMTFDLLIRR